MDLVFGKKYELHKLKRITRIWDLTPPMPQDFEVEFAINKSPSPYRAGGKRNNLVKKEPKIFP
jgi:hypothetical protein